VNVKNLKVILRFASVEGDRILEKCQDIQHIYVKTKALYAALIAL